MGNACENSWNQIEACLPRSDESAGRLLFCGFTPEDNTSGVAPLKLQKQQRNFV
jgi:hypothetical protein